MIMTDIGISTLGLKKLFEVIPRRGVQLVTMSPHKY